MTRWAKAEGWARAQTQSVADDGEVPVAVVVPRPGADPDPGDLLAWMAERVAPHKRLRAIRFAEAIPRTPSGKLLRRALRDEARRADRRASSVPAG